MATLTDFPQFYLRCEHWRENQQLFEALKDWFDQYPWNVLQYSGPDITDIFKRTNVFDVVYSREYLGPSTKDPYRVGTIVFQNQNHAIMFKLSWSGHIVAERNSVLQD